MTGGPHRRAGALATALVVLSLGAGAGLAGCGDDGGDAIEFETGGDPEAGRDAIRDLGCGTCHTVPGVRGADALVGPPLTDWAQRSYIAGSLRNTPEELERWILDPQGIEPGTAMPDVGATEEQAAHIAAYLFTLGD
ncbi:MAG: c-type cytochrome [Acidimicrobiia bacterium]